ncbi:LOW QUALITY PROTEIN: odorant receptor 22a-like [Drosophila ficusphila]|uniref:LOW QUALITY PROTEIN: odorant receptor 22a-like n=1 Tax=Drosophila ficusphila TaxID=30025 RepID=UPI001C8919A5|nr:LOW QUALITY PROTEIN: odorant receptor 22a-like [Drosophila ficusphila]
MLSKLFPRIKEKSLEEEVKSRDAFIYLDRCMLFMGWTEPNDKRWRLPYFLWSVFLVRVDLIYMPFAMTVEYVRGFKSFSAGEFLSSFEIGVNVYGSSIKCSCIMLGYKKMQKAKRLLDQLDESCVQDEEKITVRRYVALASLCYIIYHILYSSFVALNFFYFLTIRSHAWRMYYPLVDSDDMFFLSSIAEGIMMTVCVTMDQCSDVCPLMYTLMARCHITLLKKRLRNLRSVSEMTEDEHFVELTNCIKQHRLILDYFKASGSVFSRTVFVEFLLIGVVLGLSMINLMFFSTLWTGFVTCLFMVDVCMETFPFCYVCNMIFDDCQELSDCVFQSNWVSAEPRYKSTMVHFLHNLQQPVVLLAGGVFPICLQTNLSMVKLAFSVVTIIKQFDLAARFQ